jgi:hypothetical protein
LHNFPTRLSVLSGNYPIEELAMQKLFLAAAFISAISSPVLAQSVTATNPANARNLQTLRQQIAPQARPSTSARQAPISGAQWWQDRGNAEDDLGVIYHR